MKKLLFTLLILPLVLAACGKDDDEDNNRSLDIEIKVGGTHLLPSGVYSTITPANSFIATVKDNGEIKGVHAGKTTAVIKSGKTTYNCKISVDANTTLYIDCSLYLGLNKTDIIKLYGDPIRIDKKMYFFKGLVYEKQLIFTFDDNNIVTAAGIEFTAQYAKLVGEHLADRYVLIGVSDGIIMYLNTYDSKEKNAIAVLVGNNSSVIRIMYTRINNTSKGMSANSISSELLYDVLPQEVIGQ